jgi:hypothetical protein
MEEIMQEGTIIRLAELMRDLSAQVEESDRLTIDAKGSAEKSRAELDFTYGERRLDCLLDAIAAIPAQSLQEAIAQIVVANFILPEVENEEKQDATITKLHVIMYSVLAALEAETGKTREELCGTYHSSRMEDPLWKGARAA